MYGNARGSGSLRGSPDVFSRPRSTYSLSTIAALGLPLMAQPGRQRQWFDASPFKQQALNRSFQDVPASGAGADRIGHHGAAHAQRLRRTDRGIARGLVL